MKRSINRREKRHRWHYGNVLETTYGRDIKIFLYRRIKLVEYNYLTKQLIFFDWKVQLSRFDNNIVSYKFYRKIRTSTIRHKYQYCMPPGMEICSKSGVRRTFFIYPEGKLFQPRTILTDGLRLPYDGVV